MHWLSNPRGELTVLNTTLDRSPHKRTVPSLIWGRLLCLVESSFLILSLSRPRPLGQHTLWACLPNISRTQPLSIPLAAPSTSKPPSVGFQKQPVGCPCSVLSHPRGCQSPSWALACWDPQPTSLHSSHTGLQSSPLWPRMFCPSVPGGHPHFLSPQSDPHATRVRARHVLHHRPTSPPPLRCDLFTPALTSVYFPCQPVCCLTPPWNGNCTRRRALLLSVLSHEPPALLALDGHSATNKQGLSTDTFKA